MNGYEIIKEVDCRNCLEKYMEINYEDSYGEYEEYI